MKDYSRRKLYRVSQILSISLKFCHLMCIGMNQIPHEFWDIKEKKIK